MIIRHCTKQDAAEIFQLRTHCYQKAVEFQLVEPQALDWCDTDEGAVIGAWDNAALISTLKGTVITTAESARRIGEIGWTGTRWDFPTLLLGKAATRQGLQTKGLHSVLRLLFLEAAAALELSSVSGIVFEHAPRVRLMQELGYELAPVSEFWFTDLSPRTTTLLAVLRPENYAHAIDRLRSQINPTDFTRELDVAGLLKRQLDAQAEACAHELT